MQPYDVIIVGGGIAGLGVADACAKRHLSTLLLEAKQVGQATSNNTLRIIHGGFRYLQQANLPRVIRSLNDQNHVLQSYPHAVAPLPCLMPLAARGLKSRIPVTVAAYTYGAMMKLCGSPLSAPQVLTPKALATTAPILKELGTHGALCWHDVIMTHPEAIAASLVQHLSQKAVHIKEETTALAITETDAGFELATNTGETIRAKKIVTTLGPWLNTIQLPPRLTGPRPQWCLGFNLTIKKQIHPTHAIGVQSPDGRLFFCVPRGTQTAIGTWYIPCNAPDISSAGVTPTVPPQEIDRFIQSFNRAFPTASIAESDIDSIDAGILPMKSCGRSGPNLYGSEIIHRAGSYCEVISTKYTTFRSQGVRVVQMISR
jgi:glycerol-3-phosphate dehydrogenase